MEKIPAASAMDWSIELDRGLRSRDPRTRLRALEAVGPRLRQLGACAAAPAAVASAFGVLPGEARLFAETMLLRLATEFRSADNAVRTRIVRSLLTEHREQLAGKGRARAHGGSPAWAWAVEPEQVLRRFKAVYDAGDARARALALRMFGCLAGLAKDSVHARSLLLSSLCSSNAAEVKAALFAAGCFCKLSEDFSRITLEILPRLICSPKSEAHVAVAGIMTFSELDCTLAIMHRVHEVGKQMVLGPLEDALKAEMLLALSRLASKSIILFVNQAEFLITFLKHGSSLSMKAIALKCLCSMFRRNTCHFPVVSSVFGTLSQLIDDEDFPLECKSYVFRIIQKIFWSKVPSIHHVNDSELSNLALAAECSLRSSSLEMQGAALEILVDIFCFCKQRKLHKIVSTLEISSFTGSQGIINNMPSTHGSDSEERSVNKIVTVMMDHCVSLVNQVISGGSKEESSTGGHIYVSLELKYRATFSLMLRLLMFYPCAASVALDKLRCLIEELARINDNDYSKVAVTFVESSGSLEKLSASNDTVKPAATDFVKAKLASTEFNSKKKESIVHNLILCTLRFANACHDMLCKKSGADLQHNIKGLVKCIQQSASQYCSTYESFCLIMHACISWNTCKIRHGNQESGDSKEHPGILFSPSVWIAQELCALRMTKVLVRKHSYWEAYRSAMYCCREGLWFTASFIFRKVADSFESGPFSFWFKSLLLFSAGEIEFKLLLFPSAIIKLVNELETDGGDLHEDLCCVEEDADSTLTGSSELHAYQAKVPAICGRMCLANDTLLSNTNSDIEFFFQRWFISLRASFLGVLMDILGILSPHSSVWKDMSHDEAIENRENHLSVATEHNNDQILGLANCSLKLSDLAKSYDLLAISHGDMDHQSFSSIARLAFMCSLLSFCTAFSVDFSKVPSNKEPCKLPKRFSHASILQDLHERVDRTDREIVSQLRQFMSISCYELDSLQFSTQMNCLGHLEKDFYSLCKFAVGHLFRVHVDFKGMTNGENSLSPLHTVMQFLSSVLHRFMELPFAVPKYFFRVRPCLGAELFIFDSNPANRDRISVSPGFQLSLTLCLQWKCVLERIPIRITKLYCILATSPSPNLDIAGTRSRQFEIRTTAQMVVLNTKLLQHIKNDPRKTSSRKDDSQIDTDLVAGFACFEPAENGQGFSDCLLNVSSFPEGSYQIVWQGCCVDEKGSYFCLLPLNDGITFSIQKS